jgi:TRAP-type transport system periplasmic protein
MKAIQIRMGGYGPATTCFSKALTFIGEKLQAEFGKDVDVKYVWNIMELGYRAEDILWLVEHGLLTLGYQSSSYLTDRVPELGVVDLPFLFANKTEARNAIDGELGQFLARKVEERVNYRILGYFENGFRHVSNRLRPVRQPADLAGMRIRVLPSRVQARTFELLGTIALRWDLTEALAAIVAGTIDAQENPLANTITSTRSPAISTSRGRFSCTATRSTPGPRNCRMPCARRSRTPSRCKEIWQSKKSATHARRLRIRAARLLN